MAQFLMNTMKTYFGIIPVLKNFHHTLPLQTSGFTNEHIFSYKQSSFCRYMIQKDNFVGYRRPMGIRLNHNELNPDEDEFYLFTH